MRWVSEFRDGSIAKLILERINELAEHECTLMEVCGTHTMAIARFGIRQVLPKSIRLVSGPGCPVCVTTQSDIDRFISIGQIDGVVLATFGDMVKVPGSKISLRDARAHGIDVRVVYSPFEAVELARQMPNRKVVFVSIGFETTTPGIALAIMQAEKERLRNFFIYPANKLVPPAMKALLSFDDVCVDGFICPGHVSTIIGTRPYEPIATDYGKPCVIAGFEPLDILQAVFMLLMQIRYGQAKVENQYRRVVRPEGNEAARKAIYEVFEPNSVEWRGLGLIECSGLKLRSKYEHFDALLNFDVQVPPTSEHPECQCGRILRGAAVPTDCPLFASACTPEHPIGPCMVSSEGACAAYFRYREVSLS
ncbi:MAG: hydrogenase formation protein HypD [Armatimonadota bacterium]|nr:hydrogenase formation protein HypD [Armatimonadota bacterium]MCX7778284.1 hydrogenase formation protein HypD [Armatimonadota bacterium]MDW8026437.1 hydrogenase formation protein HypD [Armatimonadota bacterium]